MRAAPFAALLSLCLLPGPPGGATARGADPQVSFTREIAPVLRERWWAARGAPRSQVLNGFLAGLAGVALYLCLTAVAAVVTRQDLSASLRPAYLLAHALKLAGGAVGGWLAARRQAAPA